MSKKTSYTCNACGHDAAKWLGQCPGCDAWNTLQEGSAPAPAGLTQNRFAGPVGSTPTTTLSEIKASEVQRIPTSIDELDRVLGGGIVLGGVTLFGGDPGIGKSTLLLQAAKALSKSMSVLYVTGEESADELALRAQRLGLCVRASERLPS